MEKIKKWSNFINEEILPVSSNNNLVMSDKIKPNLISSSTKSFPISNYVEIPIQEKDKYKKVSNGKLYISFFSNGRVAVGDNTKKYVGNYLKSKSQNSSTTEEQFFKDLASRNYDILEKDHFELESTNGYTIRLYKNGQLTIDKGVMGMQYYQLSDMNIKTKKDKETGSGSSTNKNTEHTDSHKIDIIKTSNFYYKENFGDIPLEVFFKKITEYLVSHKPENIEKSKKLDELIEKTKTKEWKTIDQDGVDIIKLYQEAKKLKKVDGIPGDETHKSYLGLSNNDNQKSKKSDDSSVEKETKKEDQPKVKINIILPNLDKKNNKGVVQTESDFFKESEQKFVEATDDDYENLGDISNINDDNDVTQEEGIKVFGDRGKLHMNMKDIKNRFTKHWWKATLTSDSYNVDIFAREGQFLTRAFRDNEYTFQIDFSIIGSKTFAINHDIICKISKITKNEVIDNISKTKENDMNASKIWSWDEFFLLK